MAIFKNSTFGTMRKSIGDDVAYRSGGQNIVRKKPAYVNDPQTQAQLNQRGSFSLIIGLFRSLSSILKTSFPERQALHSAYNVFTSINLRNAVLLVGNVTSIIWPSLQIAKGTLKKVVLTDFTDNGNDTATVDIASVVDGVSLFDTDKIKVIGINEAIPSNTVSYTAPAGDGFDQNVALPAGVAGDTCHFYAYHVSNTGAKVSDSLYIGSAVLA